MMLAINSVSMASYLDRSEFMGRFRVVWLDRVTLDMKCCFAFFLVQTFIPEVSTSRRWLSSTRSLATLQVTRASKPFGWTGICLTKKQTRKKKKKKEDDDERKKERKKNKKEKEEERVARVLSFVAAPPPFPASQLFARPKLVVPHLWVN